MVAGGAGNAASNVAALGARARLVGLVGADPKAAVSSRAFTAGVDRAHVVRARQLPHARQDPHSRRRRTRGPPAGRPHRSRRRLAARESDQRRAREADRAGARGVRCRSCCPTTDPGSSRRSSRKRFGARWRAARGGGPIPVLLDSRYRLLDYRGLTTCTPNESEVEAVLGTTSATMARRWSARGGCCCGATLMQAVLITRGSRGMALFQPRQPTVHVPIFGSDEVTDVTGAGDTVIATFGSRSPRAPRFIEAARLANYAAASSS